MLPFQNTLLETGEVDMLTLDQYVAAVDTAILALLIGWSIMDRFNIYFRNKD